MKCSSCGAEIKDESPAFCPRCGSPLAAADGEATTQLPSPAQEAEGQRAASSTEEVAQGEVKPSDGATGTKQLERSDLQPATTEPQSSERGLKREPVAGELLRSLGSIFRREGAGDLLVAAVFGFLVMVAVGAALVAAARLQYPFLGEDASSFSVLSAIVMVGLATLGAPIEIGDISVSALPIGGMLVVGLSLVWASRRLVGRGPAVKLGDAVRDGMKVAIPFALLCWGAALTFRLREPPTPSGVSAGAAAMLGLLWAALFGAIGGLINVKPLRFHVADVRAGLAERSRALLTGASAGVFMLVVTGVATTLAGLVWIIIGLLDGSEGGLDAGEVGAGVIYLVAFAPNVLIAIAAVAHGAPLEIGAQISSAGRRIGSLESVSLSQWGDSSPPWFAFLLLLIPLAACLMGGFHARRTARRDDPEMHVLGAAALVYSIVLGVLAALSEARLGAGLVREKGFGKVSPDPALTFLLAAAWALVAGYAGWKLAETQTPTGETGGASDERDTGRTHDESGMSERDAGGTDDAGGRAEEPS